MRTVLVTGANRGIGLEFVKQYAGEGWRVLACCRSPVTADALNGLAEQKKDCVTVYSLDVAVHEDIENLSRELSNESIDLLINNAGIYPALRSDGFGKTDYEAWASAFHVNAMAPLKVAESFVSQVTRSKLKTIVTITSKMGSVADNRGGGSYVYRSSKAAVNMVMKSVAIDLASTGVISVLLHPGWVRTDMGGPNGLISTQQSVSGMRQVISKLKPENSGEFYAFDGQMVPW